MTALTGLTDNQRSAAFMMFAMLGYVLNDTMTKIALVDLSLFQVVLVRGLILNFCLGVMVWRRGEPLNPFGRRDKMLWLRVSAEILLGFCFLTALNNMPLANVTAIMQATPLTLTVVLALAFGERVGWRRYTAIAIGFVGILIIVRPGTDGFNGYALLVLLAVGLLIVRDLATQRVQADISSLSMVYITAVSVMLVNGVLLLFAGWRSVSTSNLLALTAAALFIFVGFFFSVLTMRVGEASYTATFRYTVLVWAILISIFVFGDIPDGWTLLGCAIVAAAGIYTLYRERVVKGV